MFRTVYFGSTRVSVGKNLACDYCTENIPIDRTKCQNNPLQISDLGHQLKTLKDLKYLQHIENCKCDRLTAVEFPTSNHVKFTKEHTSQKKAYTLFADFETLNTPEISHVCNQCTYILKKM